MKLLVSAVSLGVLLLAQTVYVVRFISALEAKQLSTTEVVNELKTQLSAMSVLVTSSAVPQAQTNWRLNVLEQGYQECRSQISELRRERPR